MFDLPPSVLRCFAQEPVGTEGAYKAAVDSFLQQQHMLGPEGAGDSLSPAQGEEQLSWPCTQDPQKPNKLPTAAQTEALSRLFDSVKTLTAKEELLQTLRTHLILHVARTHGCSKVMTGDSCTRLAIKLMTSLALGRGAFLAWDTGFSDERHGDVVVVRPMRDHTLKEVAFYNRLFAVPSVFTPAIDTKAPEKASIHRLMEAFLLRLQAQFPSTISTVYRTSEKLVKAPRDGCAAGPPGPRCLLCMCTLDVDTVGLCLLSPGCSGEGIGQWVVGFSGPPVPSAPLCLQTAPRLLGLRLPCISPRCSPLPHCPRYPPVLQGWAGHRAAAGWPGPVRGESLPCPVPLHGWPLVVARGEGAGGHLGTTAWAEPSLAVTSGPSLRATTRCTGPALLLQGGPPSPCR